MGKVAAEPLPTGGSPQLHGGGQNQKWPTSGQGGYITPAAWGVPTASEREGLSTDPSGQVGSSLKQRCFPPHFWHFPVVFLKKILFLSFTMTQMHFPRQLEGF